MSKTATLAKHEILSDFPEVKTTEAKAAEMLGIMRERKAELQKAEAEFPAGVAGEAERLFTGKVVPDIGKLRHEMQVAEGAYKLAQVACQQAQIRACGKIVEENRAEHEELVERIRNAVLELVDALREEGEFCERFYRMGISRLSFTRPCLDVQRTLLDQFRRVRDDEFRPC